MALQVSSAASRLCRLPPCAGVKGVSQPKPWRRSKIYSPEHSKQWKESPSRLDWGVSGVPPVVEDVDEREQVLNLLEQLGIDCHVAGALALPTAVEIVQQRLEFLESIGLDKQDIASYPQFLCCSVQRNMVPVVDYLEKLQITPEALPSLLKRFPMALHSSVVVDLKPVVDYLLSYGVREEFISVVLSKYPEVLGFKLEGTMSTSVAYLVGLGIKPRKLGSMITLFPELLGMKVGNNIKRKVEYLSELGFDKHELLEFLESHPYVLGYDLEEEMRPKLAFLVTTGIDKRLLPTLLAQYPDIFSVDLQLKVAEKRAWLSNYSVEPELLPLVIQKLPQFLVLRERRATAKLKYLMEVTGLSPADVGKMIVGCPQILGVKFEKTFRPNLQFFEYEMKRPFTQLVGFPDYLTYSLKFRIKPRFAKIRDRGIDCSLEWFLGCDDGKFERRLGLDFLTEAPGASEDQQEMRDP